MHHAQLPAPPTIPATPTRTILPHPDPDDECRQHVAEMTTVGADASASVLSLDLQVVPPPEPVLS